LQQAPLASIAEQFRNAIDDEMVGLGSRDPDKYQDLTRLHPYIFLYNMLWLSANIGLWTLHRNVEFIRQFQIPTSVIEHHYQNPESIPTAVTKIETNEAFRTGQVQIPNDDKRDMTNAMSSKHIGVRNIVPLIGIMALRHEMAGEFEDQKLWHGQGIEPEQYKTLVDLFKHRAQALAGEEYLSPRKTNGASEGATDTELERLLKGFGDETTDYGRGTEPEDNLKTRTVAWFKAYADWLAFRDEDAADQELASRTDDADLFNVGA
jgi:hypothetical protein